MSKVVVTHSEEETHKLAYEFAQRLGAGDVVCLRGDLGAGKTQFVKGMAARFEIDSSAVHSPTFTLVNEYPGTPPLYHFDCYRLESPREALEIGAEEYFYGEGVSVIEWPEKIELLIPEHAHWIQIETIGAESRKFIFVKERN